jgi:hypothetical protein
VVFLFGDASDFVLGERRSISLVSLVDELVKVVSNFVSKFSGILDFIFEQLLVAGLSVLTLLVEMHLIKGHVENQVHEFLHVVHEGQQLFC